MFTWICPQCGKEVPPHENECPYCREQAEAADTQPVGAPVQQGQPMPPPAAQPQAPPPPPPAAPPAQPPPPVYTHQHPAPPTAPMPTAHPGTPQQQVYAVGGQRGTPAWLVTLLVAIGLIAVGAAAYYWLFPSLRGGGATAAQPAIAFEKVPDAPTQPPTGSRIAKHIEVTGFRISENENKRTQIQFLVVNHSAADIGDLAGEVRLRTTESKPGDDPIAEFEFKTTRLAPYGSIDFKTLINTSLRAYEMPDWEFLRVDVKITSPTD